MNLASSESDLTGWRVLVIEDEMMVTLLFQDLLADIGCEIIGVASHFNDAIEKAKSLSFDVAILDVNLNGQKAFSIAESLAERGVAFVFATGYDATSLPESFHNVPLLQKPFEKRDLERALRAVFTLSTGTHRPS
jgi:two-component SAPR family response regulator